ncbi:MAG TPA: ADP-ribosylglycohydrolase family protein, partial [bacterium]|nr:ADP-ribosylglycohydrolase family protein [bacterium]
TIARMIGDVRAWNAMDRDWRVTFRRLDERYGYAKFGGNCHIVPNHAVIILGLVAGGGDFRETLAIVNTCGWDTDCNSGNAGCLMGVRGGLAALELDYDWRGPLADRIFLPTADGGRCITDAAREALNVANAGRALRGLPPLAPKGGARFHFELPGSVQGFRVGTAEGDDAGGGPTLTLANVAGHSRAGTRSLALRYSGLGRGKSARAGTATFIPRDALVMPGYELLASPTLYSGQHLRASAVAGAEDAGSVRCCLYVGIYGDSDRWEIRRSPAAHLAPGKVADLAWDVPDTGGSPIAEVGIELQGEGNAGGTVFLDCVTWTGTPSLRLGIPATGGTMWQRAWVNGVTRHETRTEPFRIVQNEGRGLLMQGTREWKDYRVSAEITLCLVKAGGVAACVQGMRRFYALLLTESGTARLLKCNDRDVVMAEVPFPWSQGSAHTFELHVRDGTVSGAIDGKQIGSVKDMDRPLDGGAVAFVCEEGWMTSQELRVEAF